MSHSLKALERFSYHSLPSFEALLGKKKIILSLLLYFQHKAVLFRPQMSIGDADPVPDSHGKGNQVDAVDLNGN